MKIDFEETVMRNNKLGTKEADNWFIDATESMIQL